MDFARYEQYRETGVHEVPGFASHRRLHHAADAAWPLRCETVSHILITTGLL